ncbi:hypothetical protein [Methylomonas methanica]|uniref:Uncharacterized protein n=1 Tax=Methylomonas methanica (strain DSM 25384 / MC09) TaxID=857087 RepID=F9ZWY2_METMM|nr:hypothetical protein [Methylomonas methanica]AEG02144.1 hypothetical protein Metme_3789 [Methylomonas methanica MC09]
MNAYKIKDGIEFMYIENKIPDSKEVEQTNFRYLGKVGSDIFIYSANDSEIIIINQSSLYPLRMKESHIHEQPKTEAEKES